MDPKRHSVSPKGKTLPNLQSYLHSPVANSPLSRDSSNINLRAAPTLERPSSSFSPRYRSVTPAAMESRYTEAHHQRLKGYHLDLPEDEDEVKRLQLDSSSPYYTLRQLPDYDLRESLPYPTEKVRDVAAYLGDIVSHIYISIKAMDLDGVISVNTAELEAAKDAILRGEEPRYADPSKEFDINNVGSEDEDSDDSDNEDDDADSDDDAAAATPVGKVEPQSAAIISLSHWTRELRVLLKMKRIIPVDLTIALIKVYYAICLSRGQHLRMSLYINVLQSLVSNDVEILKERGLVIDWRPLFKEFSCHYPHADSNLDLRPKKTLNQLSQISQALYPFFDRRDTAEIVKLSLENLSTRTTAICLLTLSSLTPMAFYPVTVADGAALYDENDVRQYLPIFFNLWTKGGSSTVYLIQLLSKIAQSALKTFSKTPEVAFWGDFGIFTERQFGMICDHLFKTVRYPTPKKDVVTTTLCSISSIILMTITNEHLPNGPLEKLATLLNAMSTFAHPSNSGPWSQHVAKTVKYLSDDFHKRVMNESNDPNVIRVRNFDLRNLPDDMKLNENTIKSIVSMLLPLINVGVQAKGREISSYLTSLQLLTQLSPEQVLDSVFMDIYPSLENSISTHRLQVVLREMNILVRFMASKPVYRIHIVRLLSALLPGIDSNDPIKARRTLELISATAAVVPFYDLSEGNGDGGMAAFQFTNEHLAFLEDKFLSSKYHSNPAAVLNAEAAFQYDPEFEVEALKSATSTFGDFLHVFTENVFRLLDNLPDNIEGADLEVIAAIPDAFAALVESVSDDLFDIIQNDVFEYMVNHSKNSLVYVAAAIVENVVKRNPETQFKKYINYFIPQIRTQIDENGAGSSRTGSEVAPRDAQLAWALEMLCGAVSASPTEILKYATQLNDISLYLLDNVKGYSLYTPTLLFSILKSVSGRSLLERRLISKDYLSKNKGQVDQRCWGGFQFDPYRFEQENLTFEWFSPRREHVEFAVESLDVHVTKSINALTSLMTKLQKSEKTGKSTQVTLEIVDQININLASLSCGLTGISQLFDPLYQKYDSSAAPFRGDLLQQKLKQLSGSTTSLSVGADTPASMSRVASNDSAAENSDAPPESAEGEDNDTDAIAIEDNKDVVGDAHMEESISIDLAAMDETGGLNTPGDDAALANPELTGRQFGLFGFGYIFGEGRSSKLGDPLYQRLHSLRDKIGRYLHDIAEQIFESTQENITIVNNLAICLEVWLRNVGYDVVAGFSGLTKSYVSFFNSQELKRLNSPFTRSVMGVRLAVMHMKRLTLSRTDRVSGELDMLLLKDLVQVAAFPFANTSRRARTVLSACFGSMLKSSPAIYHVFPIWRSAIENKDIETIKNVLMLFRTKRIKGRVERSNRNIEFLDLVTDSIRLDHPEVTIIAVKIFENVPDYVVVPKPVCLIDNVLVDAIKPSDDLVEFEVQSLSAAKRAKIKPILSRITRLENRVIEHARNINHWNFSRVALEFICVLQQFTSINVNPAAFEFVMESVGNSHPMVSGEALSGITSMIGKVFALASVDHDKKKIYEIDARQDHILEISTRTGEDFAESFKKEMQNLTSPKFFIDNSIVQPTLFWPARISVVSPEGPQPLNLSEIDRQLCSKFGSYISKDWLLKVLRLSVESMESSPVFQPTHVSFFEIVTTNTILGFTSEFTLDDLIDLTSELYNKEERATHIIVAEIYCGILLTVDKMEQQDRSHVDARISRALRAFFTVDLTQDTLSVWSIFVWWLAERADFRRFPQVMQELTNFSLDKTNESPFTDMSRLRLLTDYVGVVGGKFYMFDHFVEESFQNLSYSYRVVEEVNASLLSSLLTSYPSPLPSSFEEYVGLSIRDPSGFGYYPKQIPESIKSKLRYSFAELEKMRAGVFGKDVNTIANSDYMHIARTMIMFLGKALQGERAIEIFESIQDLVIPFLFGLEKLKDAASLAGVSHLNVYFRIGALPLERIHAPDIATFILSGGSQLQASLTQQTELLKFIKFFYHVRFSSLSMSNQKLLLQTVQSLLFSQHLEVREVAGEVFSGMIHVFPVAQVDEVVNSSIRTFTKILTEDKRLLLKLKKNGDPDKKGTEVRTRIHGAVLGLGALIDAYPYTTPPPSWLPVVLADVASKASQIEGIIGRTAKDTLSKFKKTRQDTWHIDSKFFSENQLSDLEGVLSKTYFL